jgi:outer membrane protein assembly factor BamD
MNMKFRYIMTVLTAAAAVLLQGCAAPQAVSKSPEDYFNEGEQSFRKGHYEQAIQDWKKAKESFDSPELSARAELGIADAYFLNRNYIEAASAYEDFIKLHPRHERAGYALFRQGMSYYNQIQGIDTEQTPVRNALGVFDSYVRQYPGGEFFQEAVAKSLDCKDKQLQYELYVGRFYQKQGNYPAAIARFEEALKNFRGLKRTDETLYYLGLAYRAAGQNERARAAFERLRTEFPDSRLAAEAGKKLGR